MADWTRQGQQQDRDFDRNRYDENYRTQRNYGEQSGEHNRDWENRQISGRDFGSNEQWNPEHWQNRQQGRDWEQNRNRDWEQNRNWGQGQQTGGYRGYDSRSRNEYETGDFGTRNYGGVQRTVYGGRDYGSEQNRYGSQGREQNYGSDPRRDYGNFWGSSEYDRGQQNRWGGTNYGTTYGSSTYGSPNYGSTTYGSGMQQQGRGQFVGRGPKNFNRTDDRIREDIIERLTMHPDIDATELDVQVKNGEVTLTGTVDDRDQRRLAEDMCENIWGVRDVHNQIKVNKPSLWDRMTGQTETTASGEKTKKDKAA